MIIWQLLEGNATSTKTKHIISQEVSAAGQTLVKSWFNRELNGNLKQSPTDFTNPASI